MIKKLGMIMVVILLLSTLCLGAAVTKSPSPTPVTKTPVTTTSSPVPTPAAQTLELKTQKEKLSYSIGMDIARSIKSQEIDIDPVLFAKGFNDVLSGAKPLLNEQEIKAVFEAFQQEMAAKSAERMAKLGVQNQKDSDAFFAANKTKDGVVTLPSGLQYKVLTEGKGPTPTADDTVTVNYRGTLLNGQEFDSSYTRGQPAEFPVSGVIPGFSEALKLMKVGSKWQLFIPPNLAYGENGAGSAIGPNAALIFEMELIGIKNNNPQPSPSPADTK